MSANLSHIVPCLHAESPIYSIYVSMGKDKVGNSVNLPRYHNNNGTNQGSVREAMAERSSVIYEDQKS